jgi:guanylate kinase
VEERGNLWLLVGPSGTGKTTVAKALTKHFEWLREAISHTSRAPRAGEVGGADYHFIDRTEFIRMLNDGELAEHVAYPPGLPQDQQNFYGVSRAEIDPQLDSGGDCLIIVEPNGARQILALYPTAKVIFFAPPDIYELRERLEKRGDKPETIDIRMKVAEAEAADGLTLANFVIHPGPRDYMFNAIRVLIGGLDRERGDRVTGMSFGEGNGRTVVAKSWQGTAESVEPIE